MKICIAGWYFRPTFLDAVAHSGYDAFVVKHREGDTQGLPSKLYPNLGLEFGAYRQFAENHWDGVSDVLFLHDDTEVSGPEVFSRVEALNAMGVDHAYIFHDESEEYINGGAHGRAMWIRGSILAELSGLHCKGAMLTEFPADMDNAGVNVGKVAQVGIFKFHERIKKLSSNTAVIALIPGFRFGHRGRITEDMFVYRKTHGPVPGGLVNVSE